MMRKSDTMWVLGLIFIYAARELALESIITISLRHCDDHAGHNLHNYGIFFHYFCFDGHSINPLSNT